MKPSPVNARRAGAFAVVLIGAACLAATGSQPETPDPVNLVEDPGFETGVSGFVAQDASSSLAQSAQEPIEGAYSLRFSIAGYGNNIWWVRQFQGGLASNFRISARLRSDTPSNSALRFCAMAYYADGATALECIGVPASAGYKGLVSVDLPLDAARRLASVRIRLFQEGTSPVTFTLDSAVANLTVLGTPTDDSGGGGDDEREDTGGSNSSACAPSTTGRYSGVSYRQPELRPYISLAHFSDAQRNPGAFARFRNAAEAALSGDAPYGYSATHSVVMHRLTGSAKYIDDAIARVEAFVSRAEAAIARGDRPDVAGDSYLEVGWYLEQLALTYDAGYGRLTGSQRDRWPDFAERTLSNLWYPSSAHWGTAPHSWSGWSLCDPGNNYHFSFLRATILWALAAPSTKWLDFLQTQKLGRLVDYYADLRGGGSREGTGYGTAQRSLFENYLYWFSSTGEDLAGLSSHTRESIDYWLHATVPTRDRFAPIGDQSRSSLPELYDYHENLVHAAVVLSKGTAEARRGTWWLKNNSVDGVTHSFNLLGDLLPYPDSQEEPTALAHHASGAGVAFIRSSWKTDAAWLAVVAGKYDQSHAHQDQGSFTFFRSDWLAVTPNIWSRSGINQRVEFHNVIRFDRADGSSIPQSTSDTVQSTMKLASVGNATVVTAELGNAYWRDSDAVQSWTRRVEFSGLTVRVTDTCSVADGIRPVFQLHVPQRPSRLGDGSVQAGGLVVLPRDGTATWTPLPSPEFSRGYRIEIRPNDGCAFSVELRAQ